MLPGFSTVLATAASFFVYGVGAGGGLGDGAFAVGLTEWYEKTYL